MASLYPLKDLPNKGQVWSWISFDVANQSFTLLVNTVLFSRVFTEVVSPGPGADERWSILFAASMLLTVIASPVAGAIADAKAWKREALLVTGVICAALTCALSLAGPGALWLAVLIYIPANVCFNLGENFLASFLPELARREDMGKVSGFSWACAYLAALVLLGITAAGLIALNAGTDPARWWPLFVFAGVWFFAFSVPTFLVLREKARPTGDRTNPVVAGFRRLADSARHTARYRDLLTLLVASFFYGVGMTVIVSFASILTRDFGFTGVQSVKFIALVTISGVVGTLVPTFVQDRFGHRRTTVALLVVWVAAVLAFYVYTRPLGAGAPAASLPVWPLWLFGNLIGFGLGSLGSANRAFVSYLTPPERTAECFGLWGLVFKLAAVGTIPFAIVKERLGMPQSMLVLAGFMVAGLVITLFVDEKRGAAAAAGSAVPSTNHPRAEKSESSSSGDKEQQEQTVIARLVLTLFIRKSKK
ncbi:MAG TPA: MFS transporter [Phycisphaerales bacterium]|nr:MFS transporter [Phycisphaerales bacterium]